MAYLEKLEITNRVIGVARRQQKVDDVEYRRIKLIANLEEQIELANLALQKKPLELSRKRGHKVRKVKPRIWWTVEPEGQVYTQIRFNKIPLNLAGRGAAIEVGEIGDLQNVYRTVIKAVDAGELDSAIENAIRKS